MSHFQSSTIAEALQDQARLQEIADLDLISAEVDAVLAEVATRAAEHYGLPLGCVTIVLDGAQYFAAAHGLGGWLGETRGTPVEWSFCRVTVETRAPFVVEDASVHPLTRDNPVVKNEGVRSYAGIPLITSRGHALGAFCVAGGEAREFSAQDLADLHAFAAEALRRVESKRKEP